MGFLLLWIYLVLPGCANTSDVDDDSTNLASPTGVTGTPEAITPTPAGTDTPTPEATIVPTLQPTPEATVAPTRPPTPSATVAPTLPPTPPSSPTPISPDRDGDGYSVRDGDCNDTDPNIYPGAEEIPYDKIDQDCDEVDLIDVDGDGFRGEEANGPDCDDQDPLIYPGAQEVPYDGVDQDCDDIDLNDVDDDGYVALVAGGDDCDDNKASIHPQATEIPYDGIDQDCSGADLSDVDGDGFDGPKAGGTDCNDKDASISPAASEVCDTADNNCDGVIDADAIDRVSYYTDADQDGYGDPETVQTYCAESAPGSLVLDSTDCNDNSSDIHPGAEESCDGIDNDCSGTLDDAFALPYRKEIRVSGASSDLEDFQIRFEFARSASMNADYNDLRFFLADPGLPCPASPCSENLPYWIEDAESGLATVVVRVPTIPSGSDTVLYMYYGNEAVEPASDGAATFLFFDDFDSPDGSAPDPDKWSYTPSGGAVVEIQLGMLRTYNPTGSSGGRVASVGLTLEDYNIVEFRSIWPNWGDNDYLAATPVNIWFGPTEGQLTVGTPYVCCEGQTSGWASWSGFDINTTYHFRETLLPGEVTTEELTTGSSDTHETTAATGIAFGDHSPNLSHTTYYDNVRVRKCTVPELTIAVGSEESCF